LSNEVRPTRKTCWTWRGRGGGDNNGFVNCYFRIFTKKTTDSLLVLVQMTSVTDFGNGRGEELVGVEKRPGRSSQKTYGRVRSCGWKKWSLNVNKCLVPAGCRPREGGGGEGTRREGGGEGRFIWMKNGSSNNYPLQQRSQMDLWRRIKIRMCFDLRRCAKLHPPPIPMCC
jgi:hypothetical protein